MCLILQKTNFQVYPFSLLLFNVHNYGHFFGWRLSSFNNFWQSFWKLSSNFEISCKFYLRTAFEFQGKYKDFYIVGWTTYISFCRILSSSAKFKGELKVFIARFILLDLHWIAKEDRTHEAFLCVLGKQFSRIKKNIYIILHQILKLCLKY